MMMENLFKTGGWLRGDITYCSNVHAGDSLEEVLFNIENYILPVRQQRHLESMTTGLWLSARTASILQRPDRLQEFQTILGNCNLTLTSLNGFPYGDFHGDQVKQAVYLPDWADRKRVTYTKHLANILAACLPDKISDGAVSTLPLGYKRFWNDRKQSDAESNLQETLTHLSSLFESTGKHIILCLEMEPDCVLESTDELIEFYQKIESHDSKSIEHLGICFDVCHQAVMHEDIMHSLERIISAGIRVGKIQLSNALRVNFGTSSVKHTLEVLQDFSEPKYLHQVKTIDNDDSITSSPDLAAALDQTSVESLPYDNPWRIHFHVPLDADTLSDEILDTTRSSLIEVFDFLEREGSLRPYLETETYTWQVLPEELRPRNDVELIMGIANELNWVEVELSKRNLLSDTEQIHA